MNFPNDTLLEQIFTAKKEDYDFFDIANLSNCLDREIVIPIELVNCAVTISSLIRYWNRVDKENNIAPADRKPIKIYIDCMGGDLQEAFTICDAIMLSATPVFTITTGAAYSGAFLIAICGHKRFAYPHSSFLFHEGAGGFGGDANKFANFASFYKRQIKQMKELVLKKTNITEEKYMEIKNDDYWMLTEDAIELNVIDEIKNKV